MDPWRRPGAPLLPGSLPPSRSSSSTSTTRSQAAGLQALTSPAADVSWQPGLCSPLRSQRRGKMLLSVPPRAGINPYSGYNSRNSKKVKKEKTPSGLLLPPNLSPGLFAPFAGQHVCVRRGGKEENHGDSGSCSVLENLTSHSTEWRGGEAPRSRGLFSGGESVPPLGPVMLYDRCFMG